MAAKDAGRRGTLDRAGALRAGPAGAFRAGGRLFAARLVQVAAGLALLALAGHRLAPPELSRFLLYLAAFGWLRFLAAAGFVPVLLRLAEGAPAEAAVLARARRRAWLVAPFWLAPCLVLGGPWAVALAAAGLLALALAPLGHAAASELRAGRTGRLAASEALAALVPPVLALGLPPHAAAFALGPIAAAPLGALLFWLGLPPARRRAFRAALTARRPPPAPAESRAARLVLAGDLLRAAWNQGGQLLLGALLGPAFALFAVPWRLALRAADFAGAVGSARQGPWGPAGGAGAEDFTRLLPRALALGALAGLALALPAELWGAFLLPGHDEAAAVLSFRLLGAAVPFLYAGGIALPFLLARGRERAVLALSGSGLLAAAVLLPPAALAGGAPGGALAFLLVEILSGGGGLWLALGEARRALEARA